MSFTRILGLRRLITFRTRIYPLTLQLQHQRFNHNIDLNDTAVHRYLRYLVNEYTDLQMKRQHSAEEIARLRYITPIVKVLGERIALHENIESLKELNKQEEKDEDMRKQIKEEATIYLSRLNEIDNELKQVLLEGDQSTGGVIVEVTAGVGGQEAMLFAGELLNMYEGYARHRDWQTELLTLDKTEIGGLRKGSLLIQGLGVPELMKLEAGVHRVQRIPSTEKGGRIHTSTVTVAVLPEITDSDIEIPERDVTVETKRASGAGGQHVNTTDSAVRLTHIPTGIIVECQEGRSQINNRKIAFNKLRTILLERQQQQQHSEIKAQRKSQVGSGQRNEKIRTYNFPQDRVTEHRGGGGSVHNLRGFLEGGESLAEMHEAILSHERYSALMQDIQQIAERERSAADN